MLKNLDTPTSEEIHAYHAWMEKHSPLDRTESLFLSRKTDLLSLTQRRRPVISTAVGGVGAGPGTGPKSAAIGFPLILVLPLMAFAVVPGVLGRLFMLILIGVAELMLVTSTELMDLMSVREWVICSSV
jgi:uncharacterized membrane protein